jgi:glycerophosphoryl diester phosphodiesterase
VAPPRERKKTLSTLWLCGESERVPSPTATRPPAPARPRVIAHRGASGHAPENTLAAFLLAAEVGADGIELDVHLTADGEVVVMHNDTVDATTDGRGPIRAMTLHELKALDAGRWYDARYAGERVPTLAEVFQALGRRLLINVEIKAERGLTSPRKERGQLEAGVVRLIEDHAMAQQVLISSFSASTLRRVHRLKPSIPLGFLYAQLPRLSSRPLLRLIRAWVVPYHALHPALGWVDAGRATWARRMGLPLNVWTVNAADHMRRMRDLEVGGIITNYPDRLIQVLAEGPG